MTNTITSLKQLDVRYRRMAVEEVADCSKRIGWTWLETRSTKFDHIVPVLRQLQWLPVRRRILNNLAMIVFN